MIYKAIILLLITTFFFCSCGALLKERQIVRNGIEKHDFDLPVFLYPSSNSSSKKILFLFSGDGGWIEFEDNLAVEFAKNEFTTIGLNSRTYFWKQKTPQQTARDLILLINKYSKIYNSKTIYLAGYSFGADVIPFVYNLLPEDIKRNVIALQMLSPFASTDFDVHIINLGSDNYPYKVKAEIENIKIPTFCFYGEREDQKALKNIKQKNFFLKLLPGNHHYQTIGYKNIISSLDQRGKSIQDDKIVLPN
jgi:type IV secretory pathway VirJ component